MNTRIRRIVATTIVAAGLAAAFGLGTGHSEQAGEGMWWSQSSNHTSFGEGMWW